VISAKYRFALEFTLLGSNLDLLDWKQAAEWKATGWNLIPFPLSCTTGSVNLWPSSLSQGPVYLGVRHLDVHYYPRPNNLLDGLFNQSHAMCFITSSYFAQQHFLLLDATLSYNYLDRIRWNPHATWPYLPSRHFHTALYCKDPPKYFPQIHGVR
jgi:hypothetical protein